MVFKRYYFNEKAFNQLTIGANQFVIHLKNYESGAIYCQKLALVFCWTEIEF